MGRHLREVSGSLIIMISAALLAGRNCAAEGIRPTDEGRADSDPIAELQKDAEQGNPKAQYVLGCCFNGDHGTPRDPVKAAKWWGMAAANGIADAQFCLGLSFFMGEGVPKDVALAVIWWGKAAEQDNPDAEYFLGLSYHTGIGAIQSTPKAIYWLKKSAGNGCRAAAELLKEIGKSPG